MCLGLWCAGLCTLSGNETPHRSADYPAIKHSIGVQAVGQLNTKNSADYPAMKHPIEVQTIRQ